MININYVYSFCFCIGLFFLSYFIISLRPNKNNLNNKLHLKNLLESLDLDLPDELKQFDNSSTDPRNLS